MKLQQITDEGVIADMTKALLPTALLRKLKQTINGSTYQKVIKLQRSIVDQQALTPHMALIKAAAAYGISPKDISDMLET